MYLAGTIRQRGEIINVFQKYFPKKTNKLYKFFKKLIEQTHFSTTCKLYTYRVTVNK